MSLWLQIVLWCVCGIIAAVMLIAFIRTKRPVSGLMTSGLQGLCALAAVDLVGMFTGVSLGFGWLSLGVSALLGIPGVITLLLLRCVFL